MTDASERDRSRTTRRALLAGLGTAMVGGAVTRRVAAEDVDLEEIDDTYSNVTTEFDKSTLRQFQPLLVMQSEDRDKFKHQLAYVARSDEYQTYACCYITRYTVQNGVGNADSHLGDTEPVYVFVNEDTDSPTEVVFSAWHWNAAGALKQDANLSASRVDSETHVSLTVENPHHHYTLREDDRGVFYDLTDWHDYRQRLVDNGLYDRGEPAAFEEPWVMSTDHDQRAGWWNGDGAFSSGIPPDVHTDYMLMQLWQVLGIRGSDTRQEDLR